jgi:hypothetical protein
MTSRRSFLRVLGIGAAAAPAAFVAAKAVAHEGAGLGGRDNMGPAGGYLISGSCGSHTHTITTWRDSGHTHSISVPGSWVPGPQWGRRS